MGEKLEELMQQKKIPIDQLEGNLIEKELH